MDRDSSISMCQVQRPYFLHDQLLVLRVFSMPLRCVLVSFRLVRLSFEMLDFSSSYIRLWHVSIRFFVRQLQLFSHRSKHFSFSKLSSQQRNKHKVFLPSISMFPCFCWMFSELNVDDYKAMPPLDWHDYTPGLFRVQQLLQLLAYRVDLEVFSTHYMYERLSLLDLPSIRSNIDWDRMSMRMKNKDFKQTEIKKFTVRRSKISSPGSLFSINNFKFLYTRGSTLTLLLYLKANSIVVRVVNDEFHFYLILSLPRKSNSTTLSPMPSTRSKSLMCSIRNEQQPTVSASSWSFSLPTRRASWKEGNNVDGW